MTDTYDDATFRKLLAPAADATALAEVLSDSAVGGYEVLPVLHNAPMHQTTLAIEDLLADARRDDVALLYFSGHGVKNDAGELYLPSTNSLHSRLASTAVSSLWIRQRMDVSRSRHIMVWLDCCYAGAFPPGALHRAGEDVDALAQLGGRGSAVMTSSSSLEYAYETTENASATVTGAAKPSVFTGVVVNGLRTGDADLGGDGLIDVDELYEYVYARMQESSFQQTPTLQSRLEGQLYVARSARGESRHESVAEAYLRVVDHLRESILVADSARAARERALLAYLAELENQPVAQAARRAIEATRPSATACVPAPTSTLPLSATPLQPAHDGVRGRAGSLGLRLAGYRKSPDADPGRRLDQAAIALATMVEAQWTVEARARTQHASEPLTVRWSSTGRPVSAPPTAVLGTVIPGRPLRLRLRGKSAEIAGKFRQLPYQQLVILGAPGSGKTMLATQLLLGLLADGAGLGAPVPVLLPVSTWNPHREAPYEWMARMLIDAYPALADRAAVADQVALRLLNEHRVIPILDGLDEMPPAWQHVALAALSQEIDGTGPLALTCRSAEYEAAVTAGGSFLSHAAVIELEPLSAVDTIGYVQAGESPDDRRWNQICEHLRLHPHGVLAEALSTPLMLDLATTVYAERTSEPAELLDTERFADRASIEGHLLDAYIGTRFARAPESQYPAPRARQWLSFLADHLDRLGTRELEWWRIAQATPRWVVGTFVAVFLVLLFVLPLTGSLVASNQTLGVATAPAVGGGLAIGVALAAVLGQRAGRTAQDPRDHAPRDVPRAVLHGVLNDLHTVISVVSSMFALLLTAAWALDRTAALELSYSTVQWLRQALLTRNFLFELLLPIDMILTATIVPNLLAVFYGGLPRRGVPRLRRLGVALGIGMPVGLVLTAPAIVLGAATHHWAWLATGLIVGLFTGLLAGLGRWLATPLDHQNAASPYSALHSDRATVLALAGATMAVTFLISGGAIGILIGSWAIALAPSAIIGLLAALVVVLGSGSAWLSYSVARFWLALRGSLPWRLTRFLRECHERGLLRQTGPVYQFRHTYLQDRLVQGGASRDKGNRRRAEARSGPQVDPPTWTGARSTSTAARLWRRLVIPLVLPVVAFGSMTAFVYVDSPRPLRTISTGYVALTALSKNDLELATIADPNVGDIEIRDLSTGRLVHARYRMKTGSGLSSWIEALAFTPDGTTLIAVTDDGTVVRWQATTGKLTSASMLGLPQGADAGAAGFDPTGSFLAVVIWSFDSDFHETFELTVWKLAGPTGKPVAVASSSVPASELDSIGRVAVSDSGEPAPVSPLSGNLVVWRSDTANSVSAYDYRDDPDITSVALSPNGDVLADVDDGIVHAWNVRTGNEIVDFVPPVENFNSIAFGPDGHTVITTGDDDVRLWSTGPD